MAIFRVNKTKTILSQETKTPSKPFSAEVKSIYAYGLKRKGIRSLPCIDKGGVTA